MVFSSTIFLFLFLPATLAVYVVSPQTAKNSVLLAASLIFYAWGETIFVLVMLASICFNYLAGLIIELTRKKGRGWLVLAVGVSGNIALLVLFKYANFLIDNLDLLSNTIGMESIEIDPVHLPIGISFFTFQSISYLVDVYRGDAVVCRNPFRVALYISMFPQLVAGPIVRYRTIAEALCERTNNWLNFSEGVQRFIIGLAKKILIANPMGFVADQVFAIPSEQLTTPVAWLGLVCYTLQIYYDFSGYSDMAIGLGRMFGFKFPENFNYPYISQSVREFWRRWHISLSSWFRDYLYIPLGGNRGSAFRTSFNLIITFVLCGLWHGASWTFLIWGVWHGVFLVLERGKFGHLLSKLPTHIRHFYLLLIVMIGWVFFRAENIEEAGWYLVALSGFGGRDPSVFGFGYYATFQVFVLLVVGIIGATPVPRNTIEKLSNFFSGRCSQYSITYELFLIIGLIGLLFLSGVQIAVGTYNPFIYFRF